MTVAFVTFSIKPGRVPDCRALIKAAPQPAGLVAYFFVEIGVVNTIIALCETDNLSELSQWASARSSEAQEQDFLRGIYVDTYSGTLPSDLTTSPAIILERTSDKAALSPLNGEIGRGLNLLPHQSLDAALQAAITLRQKSTAETAMLIPEHL